MAAMVAKDSLASYAPLRFRNIVPKRRGVEGEQNENIPFRGMRDISTLAPNLS
jgi:hypothetical protein